MILIMIYHILVHYHFGLLVLVYFQFKKDEIIEILLVAIRKGIFFAAILLALLSYITCGILFGFKKKIT